VRRTIGFAMECFEKVLSKEYRGVELVFGSGEACLPWFHLIGKREKGRQAPV